MDELVKPINLEDTIITLLINQSLTSKNAKTTSKPKINSEPCFFPSSYLFL
jgi:hypothetical protein